MNVKDFINCFPEISDKPDDEQIVYLERARRDAIDSQGLTVSPPGFLISSFLFGFFMAALLFERTDFFWVFGAIYLALGIIVIFVKTRMETKRMLGKGLEAILKRDQFTGHK